MLDYRSMGWLVVAAVAVAAACGGKSVLDAPLGDGGASSSSSSSTSSGSSSSTSSSSSSSTSSSSSSSSATSTSTSTSGVVCDNTGDCNMCADCTFQGACQQSYDDCINQPDCLDFSYCLNDNCNGGDPSCWQQCEQQHPVGAPLYWALIDCVVCQQCPNDCGATPEWCAQAAQ